MSAQTAAADLAGFFGPAPAERQAAEPGRALPARIESQVRELLKVPPGDDVPLDRVLEILPHLLRLALVADTVAWGVWRQKLSAGVTGPVRAGVPLQRVLREHMTLGDGDAVAEVDRLRELVRAIASGVAQCGGEVASRVMQRFSPAEIEAAVGGGGLRGRDSECWREFRSRAERFDSGALEKEVTGVMARFVEKWMRHADAGPRSS